MDKTSISTISTIFSVNRINLKTILFDFFQINHLGRLDLCLNEPQFFNKKIIGKMFIYNFHQYKDMVR